MVLGQHGGARAKPVTDNPLPTVASRGAISKFTASPFVLPKNGKQRGLFSNKTYLEQPLHTIVAGRIDQGYSVTPYLVPFYGERSGQRPRTHNISEPHPTIPASAIKRGLIEPYLVEYYGNGKAQPVGLVIYLGYCLEGLDTLGLIIIYNCCNPIINLQIVVFLSDDYNWFNSKLRLHPDRSDTQSTHYTARMSPDSRVPSSA
jgi:hypothetical protein